MLQVIQKLGVLLLLLFFSQDFCSSFHDLIVSIRIDLLGAKTADLRRPPKHAVMAFIVFRHCSLRRWQILSILGSRLAFVRGVIKLESSSVSALPVFGKFFEFDVSRMQKGWQMSWVCCKRDRSFSINSFYLIGLIHIYRVI